MNQSETTLRPTAGCSRNKAEGAFVALAAGDALGWPREFQWKVIRAGDTKAPTEFPEWVRRSGTRFAQHEELIRRGEYSDDTQLTLAVARSRINADTGWWNAFTRVEIPFWTMYERGGGGALKRAARSWSRGTPPWKVPDKNRYFSAGGNGVAMRVLPHAVFFAGNANPRQMLCDVIADGIATHGHPRALVGAAAYAYAAWWLIRLRRTVGFGEVVDVLVNEADVWGKMPAMEKFAGSWLQAAGTTLRDDYSDVWRQTVCEMCTLLLQARDELKKESAADDNLIMEAIGAYGASKGSGTVSATAAIYLASRYAAQPTQAVLKAVFADGADTDTVAAMSGGLVGCIGGGEWIPAEWQMVQDHDYIRKLARRLATGETQSNGKRNGGDAVRPDIKAIYSFLLESRGTELMIGGIGNAEVVEAFEQNALTRATSARTWLMRIGEGQTVYVTKASKLPKDQSVSPARTKREPGRSQIKARATVVGVGLRVRKLTRATAFYKNVLGLRLLGRAENVVRFESLDLVETDHAAWTTDPAGIGEAVPSGVWVQILVPDLDQCLARVRKAGAEATEEIGEAPLNGNFFLCYDPEGNLLKVVGESEVRANVADQNKLSPELNLVREPTR